MRINQIRPLSPLGSISLYNQYQDQVDNPPNQIERGRHTRRRRLNFNNKRGVNPAGGYWLPSNYAEMMYRRKNGPARFQQAMRKKKNFSCLAAITATVVIAIIIAFIIAGITYILVAKYKQTVLAYVSNSSQVYISTGELY